MKQIPRSAYRLFYYQNEGKHDAIVDLDPFTAEHISAVVRLSVHDYGVCKQASFRGRETLQAMILQHILLCMGSSCVHESTCS